MVYANVNGSTTLPTTLGTAVTPVLLLPGRTTTNPNPNGITLAPRVPPPVLIFSPGAGGPGVDPSVPIYPTGEVPPIVPPTGIPAAPPVGLLPPVTTPAGPLPAPTSSPQDVQPNASETGLLQNLIDTYNKTLGTSTTYAGASNPYADSGSVIVPGTTADSTAAAPAAAAPSALGSYLTLGAIVLAIGTAGYFGWKWYKKHKAAHHG